MIPYYTGMYITKYAWKGMIVMKMSIPEGIVHLGTSLYDDHHFMFL